MNNNWIVVANRVEARIFKQRDMRLLHKLTNSLGREKNRAFTTDKPGWGRNRLASPASTHNLTGNKNPHDDAAIDFARRLGRFLEKKLAANTFNGLLITAEPRMMGWMKRHMDQRLLKHCEFLGKDLGRLSVHELKLFFKNDKTKVHDAVI